MATLASPKRTLWRLRMDDEAGVPAQISLSTGGMGFSPRLGPDYLLYVSEAGAGESFSKLSNGTRTELWRGEGARVIGGPAISADGKYVAFSVRQRGQSLLYVMDADGSNARIVADSLDWRGAPAWAPDGKSITSAATRRMACHVCFACRLMGWGWFFCWGVLGGSCVVAGWWVCGVFGGGYWDYVRGEGGYGRGCGACAAGADFDAGEPASGVSKWGGGGGSRCF